MAKRKASSPGRMAGSAKRTRSTPAKTIGKIARDVVLRMAEKKVYRRELTELAVSSATLGNQWHTLSDVLPGTGWGERTGKEIRLNRLDIKGIAHNNSTGTHIVRMIVGYFKDQGTPDTTTELFESGTASGGPLTSVGIGGGSGIRATLLPINKAKFTVLSDQLIKLGALASVDGHNVKTFSVRKALAGTKITFEGPTTGPNNQDKHLWIGFWTAEGANDAAGGTTAEVSFVSSLHYTDF